MLFNLLCNVTQVVVIEERNGTLWYLWEVMWINVYLPFTLYLIHSSEMFW